MSRSAYHIPLDMIIALSNRPPGPLSFQPHVSLDVAIVYSITQVPVALD